MPTRSIVTGAAGFIGSHLTEALLAAGHRVVGIDAFTPYYEPAIKRANIAASSLHPNFELLPADLNELDLDEILQPGDVIFHLAAQPGVRQSWGEGFPEYSRHNVEATHRLLAASSRRKVARVIFASSSSVYGDAPLPMDEDGPLHPVSPYGLTKRTAEELCLLYWRNFGVPVVPLRFFTVYGPRQRPDMAFNIFIRAIVEGTPLPLYGDGTQRRDFTYVDDVVAVLLAAAERAEPGVPINVGGGSAISVREALAMLERSLAKRALLEPRPAPPGDARDTEASVDRLAALGAPVQVGIEVGLQQQVAWQLGSMRRVRRPVAAVVRSPVSGASSSARPPTVLLYSHDTYGLGHLRRNSAIAHALLLREPAAKVVLLSGSAVATEWPLPASVSVVRLPTVIKVGAERYEPVAHRSMSGLRAERAGIITSTLLQIRPDIFLVDHAPLGMKGELALALEMAREELSSTRVILGLRDILDDPAAVLDAWRQQDVYRVLDDDYDQVLVYGCRRLFDVTRAYQFPASVAKRTAFTGYIAKDRGLEVDVPGLDAWSQARRSDDWRILVMGGGGADAAELFRGFLRAWRRLSPRHDGQALLVLGPLMDSATRKSLSKKAAQASGVEVIASTKRMLSLVGAADVVVSMGGYNSVVEALAARKPLVICPRVTPRREQLMRAEILARRGLARLVRLDLDGSKALSQAVSQALTAAPPPAKAWRSVDLGGADRVAEVLLSSNVVVESAAAGR